MQINCSKCQKSYEIAVAGESSICPYCGDESVYKPTQGQAVNEKPEMPKEMKYVIWIMIATIALDIISSLLNFTFYGVTSSPAASIAFRILFIYYLRGGTRLAWHWLIVALNLSIVVGILIIPILFLVPQGMIKNITPLMLPGSIVILIINIVILSLVKSGPVKIFFRLQCPKCRSLKARAGDFWFYKAKCKDCGTKY